MPAFRAISAGFLVFLHGAALAQPADPAGAATVSWSAQSAAATKPGGRVTLILNGSAQPGWHVYALKQAAGGPTPLLVSLDANGGAVSNGAVTGSAPIKFHDPAFDLDTQFYTGAFSLSVPVRLKPHLAAGHQEIALSVRFQTCNGRICQPPKTVQLSVPVNAQAGG